VSPRLTDETVDKGVCRGVRYEEKDEKRSEYGVAGRISGQVPDRQRDGDGAATERD
jgi:hypothetical protein